MRLFFGKSLLRWGGMVGAAYVLGLIVWTMAGVVYLQALAHALDGLALMGLLPAATSAVAVRGAGVAILGPWSPPIAIPQGVLSADLALAAALLLASFWLGWRQRLRGVALGLLVIFLGHLFTSFAQVWLVGGGPQAPPWSRTLWHFYTTLYQGKLLPLAVWIGLTGPWLLTQFFGSERADGQRVGVGRVACAKGRSASRA